MLYGEAFDFHQMPSSARGPRTLLQLFQGAGACACPPPRALQRTSLVKYKYANALPPGAAVSPARILATCATSSSAGTPSAGIGQCSGAAASPPASPPWVSLPTAPRTCGAARGQGQGANGANCNRQGRWAARQRRARAGAWPCGRPACPYPASGVAACQRRDPGRLHAQLPARTPPVCTLAASCGSVARRWPSACLRLRSRRALPPSPPRRLKVPRPHTHTRARPRPSDGPLLRAPSRPAR